MEELVDILEPPLFTKNGQTKTREQAYDDGNWLGTFNLWVVQRRPIPAIVYQIRGPHKAWAPGKLDVTVGGHYQAGETMHDGLREVEEELGKTYRNGQLTFVGRKPYVGYDTKGREMHNIVEVYLTEDDSPITSYALQKEEVHAVCVCPIDELIKAHSDPNYSFQVKALTASGKEQSVTVRASSFPENYDNYHLKIALLAKRYLDGDTHLIY